MNKWFKAILFLQLFGWISATIWEFRSNPVLMFGLILINSILWIVLWKGIKFVVKNPESTTSSKKANVLRWIISFPSSVFSVQIGLIIVYLFRFFLFDRSTVIISWYEKFGDWAGKIMILIALLIAFPVLYFIGTVLKFKNPIFYAVVNILLFTLLMLVIGPLLTGGF